MGDPTHDAHEDVPGVGVPYCDDANGHVTRRPQSLPNAHSQRGCDETSRHATPKKRRLEPGPQFLTADRGSPLEGETFRIAGSAAVVH